MGDLLTYRGIRRDGTAAVGRTDRVSAVELTKHMFDSRFRSGKVTDHFGRVVGRLGPDPDSGSLTWWAEAAQDRPE